MPCVCVWGGGTVSSKAITDADNTGTCVLPQLVWCAAPKKEPGETSSASPLTAAVTT